MINSLAGVNKFYPSHSERSINEIPTQLGAEAVSEVMKTNEPNEVNQLYVNSLGSELSNQLESVNESGTASTQLYSIILEGKRKQEVGASEQIPEQKPMHL